MIPQGLHAMIGVGLLESIGSLALSAITLLTSTISYTILFDSANRHHPGLRSTMGQDHLCLTDNPFLPSCCSKLPRLSTSQCAASLPCLGSHDLLVDGRATRRHMKADSSMFTNDLDLRRATATGIFVASSLVVPAGNIALTHPVNPLPT